MDDLSLETAIKLLISVLIGGIIGIEREYRNKSAGLRTLILICLGSTLFTLFSMEIGERTSPDRIASNIVNGIGFMGAGVIFTSGMGINGVTTAATIWATAALGMGVGAGHEWVSLAGCLVLVVILHLFTYLEDWIERIHQVHTYKIACTYDEKVLEHYENLLKQHRLSFKRGKQSRDGNTITSTWESGGRHVDHNRFIQQILQDPQVKLFEF
jgi:putative Mg2+ transporter-C (MgtC) family protein